MHSLSNLWPGQVLFLCEKNHGHYLFVFSLALGRRHPPRTAWADTLVRRCWYLSLLWAWAQVDSHNDSLLESGRVRGHESWSRWGCRSSVLGRQPDRTDIIVALYLTRRPWQKYYVLWHVFVCSLQFGTLHQTPVDLFWRKSQTGDHSLCRISPGTLWHVIL